jgi:hypothetical protein
MKVLTDPQVREINDLLLDIEKATCKEQTIASAEKIKAIILQAEHVTLKLES